MGAQSNHKFIMHAALREQDRKLELAVEFC